MGKYILTYHGGDEPTTREEGEKVMQGWIAWFAELGDVVVDAGAPVSRSMSVAPDGGASADRTGPDQVTGYSVVTADSLEDAVALAKGSPQLASNGRVEVGELIDVG